MTKTAAPAPASFWDDRRLAEFVRLPGRPAAVHEVGEPQDPRFFQLLGLFLSVANIAGVLTGPGWHSALVAVLGGGGQRQARGARCLFERDRGASLRQAAFGGPQGGAAGEDAHLVAGEVARDARRPNVAPIFVTTSKSHSKMRLTA